MQSDISPDVANALGFYVYAYVDPRDETVFYIGKGVGTRATDHLVGESETEKVEAIKNIRADGFEPRIDIVAYQLRDDLEASRVEATLIELIGLDRLTNIVRGRFSTDYPLRSLADFVMVCYPSSVEATDPALPIPINRQFRYGMDAEALYECARGIWVIGERRNRAKFAMAIYAGIVRKVYIIDSWYRAGSTTYKTRDQAELAGHKSRRWEFVGRIISNPERARYLGHSVAHLFRTGQQSLIVGVGLDG